MMVAQDRQGPADVRTGSIQKCLSVITECQTRFASSQPVGSKCAVYSKYLQTIPSSTSEAAARFALEPQQIARLGLTDAERAIKLQPESPDSHHRKGVALLLLEDYAEAEKALLFTLSLDAEHSGAKVIVNTLSNGVQWALCRRCVTNPCTVNLSRRAMGVVSAAGCAPAACVSVLCGHTLAL